MDREFSVSKTAEILGIKNEENVRRWIREGRLVAKRRLGRKGNVVLLEDIVEFANKPPRTYLNALVSWLDDAGIEYKKKNPKNNALAAEVATTLLFGPAAPIMRNEFEKKQKKAEVPFIIEVVPSPQAPLIEDIPNNKNSTEAIADDKKEELPMREAGFDDELKNTEEQYRSLGEEVDIKAKMVEEQIKLIKLKQELAQIQAQISVAEGQIEYYNLLLQKN